MLKSYLQARVADPARRILADRAERLDVDGLPQDALDAAARLAEQALTAARRTLAQVRGTPSALPRPLGRPASVVRARTHPAPRVQRAARHPAPEFRLVLAPLRVGDAREQVVSFDIALKEKKYNNEIAERYGLVAALLRARQIPRAKAELVRLEEIAPPHPMIEAMAGNVLMGADEHDAAAHAARLGARCRRWRRAVLALRGRVRRIPRAARSRHAR